ncbi:MAG: hypothetical protein QGG34_13695 [SAR202 cluster bacterium]|nr:hypothetical protein [SAR202 cluster bacterium]MDP6302150.1 hypothetical protein [SAR202 cluster bacterium]MDP7104869.1 hypothetical protein [SAR202 cluster bacterium]MDP7226578.1 hypothetical protein [SAR202 cluster bacterium]MDP7413818.1 hypothetical protein [SAR202 cluster bacterium]
MSQRGRLGARRLSGRGGDWLVFVEIVLVIIPAAGGESYERDRED